MKSLRTIPSGALLLVAVFAAAALADVAPPPGFFVAENALELRTNTELSGYRFFLTDASGEIEEIVLSPGTAKIFEAAGRGGAARFASVWAVPSESLEGRELDKDSLVELVGELQQEKINGQVRLLGHEFRKEVSVIESGTEQRDIYEVSIATDSGKPTAKPLAAEVFTPLPGSSSGLLVAAVGGALIFGAFLIGGLLIIRRLHRRSLK
ncbi:MAG: hypothetical protein IPM63_01965 [Acidobacteriota bacterium]|nr:MAG: hypothetical protein IPM63_01965 [Acidobacteriota bacterium]